MACPACLPSGNIKQRSIMSYRNGTIKLAVLLMSLIIMLAGCGAENAAEPSQEGSRLYSSAENN